MTADASNEQAVFAAGRKERILSRRAAVQARLKGLSRRADEETISGETAQISEQMPDFQKNVSSMLQRLSEISAQDDKDLLVSKGKVAAQVEAARAEEHNIRKALLREQVDMLDFIAVKQADATKSWAELQGFVDPTSLLKNIEQRKATVQAASETCQNLAGKIWEGVEDKELKYVKALQDHSLQLDSFLKMLTDQSTSFATAAIQQNLIAESSLQKAFLTLIDQRRANLYSRLEEQDCQEQAIFEAHAEALREYHRQQQNRHNADTEELHQVTMRIRGDFCDVQAKLENAKGAHLCNTDKLAYNERVLREQRPETQATLADQKRRIASQKKHLAKLKRAHARTQNKFTEENAKLSEEIMKLKNDIDRQRTKYEGCIARTEQVALEVQTLKGIEKEALMAKIKDAASAIFSDAYYGSQSPREVQGMVVRASSICNDEDLWSLLQRSYQEFLQLHYLRTLDAKEVEALQYLGLKKGNSHSLCMSDTTNCTSIALVKHRDG